MSSARFRGLASVAFFVTGATSLIYQMVWSRYLTLTFGGAHYSVATVVAAYMGGLGLGSLLFGRIADRTTNPARLYAVLELIIAGYGLISPLVIRGIESLFVSLHHAVEPGPALATGLRLTLVLLALALPTVLMGATLPVLTRALLRADGSQMVADLGRLYALNTLGAVAGTALAGFVLIEHLGLLFSLILAALLNALAGGAILAAGPGSAPLEPSVERPPWRHLIRGAAARFALVAAFAAGFVSLLDEIVWTRTLALLTGSSTYAFTVILVAFLLGIALGAALMARSSNADPGLALARAQMLAALGASLLLFLVGPATVAVLLAAQNPLLGWKSLLLARSSIAFLAVVPATIGFGATFPALVSLAAGEARQGGARIGLLYAANTLGAILGSLAGGFLLLRWFSSFSILRAGVLCSLGLALLGLSFARGASRRSRAAHAGLAALLALLAMLASPWPPHLLDLGAPLYARNRFSSRGELHSHVLRGKGQIVFLREGPLATVTVRDAGHSRYLRINGKTDASSSGDMITQVLTGLVPGLAHVEPRTALVIGAGSGVTARAMAEIPGLRSLDVVEIEPAVIEAGRFFEDVNGGVYRWAGVAIQEEDGRNHLLTSRRSYDLIVSEPSNPWMPGLANLFTDEFYELVLDRLAPDGVFGQWIQLYGITEQTFCGMLATVQARFPHVTLWRGSPGDTFLLASRQPLRFDLTRLGEVLTALRRKRGPEHADLLRIEDAEDLLSYSLLGESGVRLLAGQHPGFRDDPPRLEFEAYRGLYASPSWQTRLSWTILATRVADDQPILLTTAPLPPASAAYLTARASFSLHDLGAALWYMERAAGLRPDPKYLRWLGEIRLANQDTRGAREAWERAMSLAPGPSPIAARLGLLHLAEGRVQAARDCAARMSPGQDRIESLRLNTEIALHDGEPLRALHHLSAAPEALTSQLDPLADWYFLADLFERVAAAGDAYAPSLLALREMCRRVPRLVEARLLLADLLARAGNCAEAADEYAWVAASGSLPAAGHAAHARCLESLGRSDEAREALHSARRLEPWLAELAPLERRLLEGEAR